MRNISLTLSRLGAVLVVFLHGTPAQAQSFETWISGTGVDSNPCTRTAPCSTYAFALSQTQAGGEIKVLTSGNFGGQFVIDKAITIVSQGAIAFNTAGGARPAITVAAGASDVVTLRGLVIDGVFARIAGIADTGITFTSGAALHVENCLIQNWGMGIDFEPSGASQLFVSDTIVKDNTIGAGQGILIRPTGAGTADAVLERVQAKNNGLGGVVATAGGSGGAGTVINIAVRDSVSAGNTNIGILARSTMEGHSVFMMLDRVSSNFNSTGVVADGISAVVAMSNSTVTGNTTGLLSLNSGILGSYQNNNVVGNVTDGAPTATIAPK
jgi:hypothetical protein